MTAEAWRIYIQTLADVYGFSDYKWWSERFEEIQATLRGRYEVIRLGVAPPGPDATFRTMWPTDPRPMWVSHKKARNAKTRGYMIALLAQVDQRAMEDK